jgi:universal stress protein A
MHYKHILMATDGLTDTPHLITERAKAIAARAHAQLSHVHVVKDLERFGIGYSLSPLAAAEHKHIQEAENYIHDLDQAIGGKRNSSAVIAGNHCHVAGHHARKIAADLLVTGEHTPELFVFHRGEDKAILRNSTCDVLFAKNSEHSGVKNYQRILVAIDLEQAGCRSLIKRSRELAKELNAELTFVYAISKNAFENLQYLAGIETLSDLESEMECAWNKLQNLASDSSERKLLRAGSLKKILADEVKKLNIDLLVMGNHEQHGLAKLPSSTAAKVLHTVSCDVLAVYINDNTSIGNASASNDVLAEEAFKTA